MGIRWMTGLLAAAVAGAGLAAAQAPTLGAGPYKGYHEWTRLNAEPVFSATHGESFVVTYVNPVGLPAAREGRFPFAVGTVIVKEAFDNQGCKPGAPGAVFVMEKRAPGYDPAAGDWHWVRYNADGTLWGAGPSTGPVSFCAACHRAAEVNDLVFGNGTSIKATPTLPLRPCQ